MHNKHLERFVVAPVFLEAMAKIVSFNDLLTQVVVVLVDPARSHAGEGGTCTPIAHTPH